MKRIRARDPVNSACRLHLWQSVAWVINIPSLKSFFWKKNQQNTVLELWQCKKSTSRKRAFCLKLAGTSGNGESDQAKMLHKESWLLAFHFAFQIYFNKFITNYICNERQLSVRNTLNWSSLWKRNHQWQSLWVPGLFYFGLHFYLQFSSTKL